MTQDITGEGSRSLNLKLLNDFLYAEASCELLIIRLTFNTLMPMQSYENMSLPVTLISEQ